MVKKRERLEIIKDILNSVRDSKEIKPTRLLYSSKYGFFTFILITP